MRQKLSLIMTLTAWLLATGSHWDLVQTFAWGRMIVTNAQSMSLGAAVERTFQPDQLCPVCKAVEKAKQQDERAAVPGGKLAEKIVLVYQPEQPFLIAPPELESWTRDTQWVASAEKAEPPLPPPRV
jgi:hypothetical protein